MKILFWFCSEDRTSRLHYIQSLIISHVNYSQYTLTSFSRLKVCSHRTRCGVARCRAVSCSTATQHIQCKQTLTGWKLFHQTARNLGQGLRLRSSRTATTTKKMMMKQLKQKTTMVIMNMLTTQLTDQRHSAVEMCRLRKPVPETSLSSTDQIQQYHQVLQNGDITLKERSHWRRQLRSIADYRGGRHSNIVDGGQRRQCSKNAL